MAAAVAAPVAALPPAALDEAIAGAAAGVAGTLLGFPLDTVKARLQCGNARNSVSSVVRSIAAADGARGFYRGVASPLLSMTLLNTLSFRSWAAAREACGLPHHPGDAGAPAGSLAQRFAAGALVAPGVTLLSTPFELVKVQLQLDKRHRFAGAGACARAIAAEGGLRALWLGAPVNLVREGLFLGVYFTGYEQARYELVHAGVAPGLAVPLAGAFASGRHRCGFVLTPCLARRRPGRRDGVAAVVPARQHQEQRAGAAAGAAGHAGPAAHRRGRLAGACLPRSPCLASF